MKIIDIFRYRLILYLIQTLILNLFVFYSGYYINLSFDIETTAQQKLIIQFLANYTLFDILPNMYFIYGIWILVSLIPIFIYNDFKKTYSMNLLTFFFPNFFLYVFLSQYSSAYFSSYFLFHFGHTILLGIVIIIISISFSLFIKKILKSRSEQNRGDLEDIVGAGKIICPKCGVEFDSIPKFCYNCNTNLTMNNENKKD
jgi:hypothetical protein